MRLRSKLRACLWCRQFVGRASPNSLDPGTRARANLGHPYGSVVSEVFRKRLRMLLRDLAEDAQQVGAPEFIDALLGIAAAQHSFGDHG
jgi:hypothetical protein